MTGQRRERLWQSIADHNASPGHRGWAEAVCAVCVAALVSAEAAALTLRAKPRAQEMLAASDGWSAKLEEAQYITCTKRFEGRRPRTEYRLTAAGRRALQRYLDHMESLIQATRGTLAR